MTKPSPSAPAPHVAGASLGRDAGRPLRIVLAVVVAVLAARVAVPMPGSMVPQSAQTLVVLLIGAALGARDGALALAAYLVLGGAGLPVFAEGASGWPHLLGPTAGYLLGFVAAAAAVGAMADRGRLRRFWPAVAVMVAAHALILALGWARLALTMGGGAALAQGVVPFLPGAVVKGAIAAALAPFLAPPGGRDRG